MISPPRPTRRPTSVARSRAAADLGLTALAIVAALLVLRVLFAATGVSERVLAGAVVYGVSGPIVLPLEMIPAGSRPFIGGATLADVTAAVLVLTIPLFVISRRTGNPPSD